MRPHPVLTFSLLATLISLLLIPLSAVSAQVTASTSLAVTGGDWQKITVDPGPGVDQTLSLAIHPLTQQPYISYYDVATKDLKLAFPVSSGGDCGPGNTWSCNSIKYVNSEGFGRYSSIDFNSAGNWGISYVKDYPSTGVGFHGTPTSGNTQFYNAVETTAYIAYTATSFRYSASGVASFAYLGVNGTNFYLRFARYNASSNGTCGLSNHWDCETISQVYVVPTPGLGGYPSLAYMGDLPMIAYRDSVYGYLYVAARVGAGYGNCPFSNQWQCTWVDRNTVVAGGVSMVTNFPDAAIAYYDSSPLHPYLIVAAGPAGGSCGWTCKYIEDVGAKANDDAQTAIAIRNGQYLVAYTDRRNSNNTILKVAYPDPNGNCGPIDPGTNKRTWRCEVVDDGGGTKNVGKYISMGVTASNVVYIAYSNDTDKTLKVAYQLNRVFLPLLIK